MGICSSAPPDPAKKPEPDFVVSHTASYIYWWDLMIIVVVVISLIVVPLRIGFDLTDDVDWLAPDIIMDVLLVLDVVLTFFRTFEAEGEIINKRDEIVSRYLRGRFALDVVSTAPISYFALAAGNSNPAFRLNRMIRLGRLGDFLWNWERNSDLKPSVIGIIKCVFLVLYMSHFVGCIFHGLTLLVDSTVFTSTTNFSQRPFWSRYWRSFYWANVSLTGYNASTPVHWAEVAFELAVTIVAIALFGTIIGVFGNLLTNLDSSKLYFRRKMDGINDFMTYKKIPGVLADEVNDYFAYMWKSGKALEENDAIESLPSNLKQKLSFQTCYMSIRAVPFFVDVKDDMNFMGEVVKVLRPRVGLPNSYIVKKGEMGAEMYFISRGELNVVTDTGFVVFTMKDGMFFGEIALIYKTKRTATIVARTFCDMYVLTKEDFSKVMRKYPEQSKGIKNVAKERFEANQKKEEEARRTREEAERKQIEAELAAQREAEAAAIAEEAAQLNVSGADQCSSRSAASASKNSPLMHGSTGPDKLASDDDDVDTLELKEDHSAASPARPQTTDSGMRQRGSRTAYEVTNDDTPQSAAGAGGASS